MTTDPMSVSPGVAKAAASTRSEAEARMDGSYFVKGRTVHKAPERKSKAGGGSAVTLGFPVCTLSDYVDDNAAQIIADALNNTTTPA